MSRAEVQQASDHFYAALRQVVTGNVQPMLDIWGHSPDVSTLHPDGGRVVGWDAVRATWEGFAAVLTDGQVTVGDLLIQVVGDLAYTVGVEHAEFALAGERLRFEGRVTNVFRREADGWKIVHHHADTVPEVKAMVARLPGA